MGIGFAAKVVTVIIKSAINSKIGNELGKELMGISIDGVSEKSITEINNFINGKQSKIKHELSDENLKLMHISEDNIEFVREEMKDLLQKVNVTDELFRKCRYNEQNLSELLWKNYCDSKNYTIDEVSDIEKGLNAVAEVLIALECDSEEFERKLLKHISGSVDDINKEVVKISDYMQKNYGKLDDDVQMILFIVQMILEQIQNSGIEKQNTQKKAKSRTQEYFDKWNKNMFLNDFDKRDRNAGVNVKLREVYLDKHLPHYIWGKNDEEEPSTDLKELLSEYINKKRDDKMLLILGQPGIGKSTLITWMTANFTDRINDILVYKFASDLENINWHNSGIPRILEELDLSISELDGKTLILDGFDEVSIEDNRRGNILNSIYEDWKYSKNIKKFFDYHLM